MRSLKVAWNGSYRRAGCRWLAAAAADLLSRRPDVRVGRGRAWSRSIPADGTVAWEYKGVPYNTVRGATTQVNGRSCRGVQPEADYIYAGQQDGSVVALKAKTGAPVWTAQVSGAGTYGSATGAESRAVHAVLRRRRRRRSCSRAPNGGESPFRGHLDAYNAKTGALVWRSWTTPDPTQLPYILTWANPAEASQGGAARLVDPGGRHGARARLLRHGEPVSRGRAASRATTSGARSIMAVDWKTGALRWYFQEMKHDIWDLDSPAAADRS